MEQLSIFPSSPTSYHNTTKIKDKPLQAAEASAKDQEENILTLFKELSPMSPSDAWRVYERRYGSILLTSLRRGITNLTKQKLLTKTEVQKIGIYKRPEYVWKIN